MFKIFAVLISFTIARYILPIVLMVNVSTVFAKPICVPSFKKEIPPIPRQSIGVLGDGNLKCWKFGLQDFNNR